MTKRNKKHKQFRVISKIEILKCKDCNKNLAKYYVEKEMDYKRITLVMLCKSCIRDAMDEGYNVQWLVE